MSKLITIKFKKNGEGMMSGKDLGSYPCLGQPGRKYPTDIMVGTKDKSKKHWSKEFDVEMEWCILIWGQKGIYIHQGPDNLKENGGVSAGCIHLGTDNAQQVYDWVDQKTQIKISYPW